MSKYLSKRAGCAVLSVLTFVTNCVLAHALETNFWKERQDQIHQDFAALPGPLINPFPVVPIHDSIKKISGRRSENMLQAIPSSLGTVRKISGRPQPNSSIVLHIQDVHLNAEAQENIGKTVEALIENKQVDLIALEGAFAPIDLSAFRSYPHQDTIHHVADFLFQEKRLSGPIHAALSAASPAPPPIVGVDDEKLYDENVQAYRDSSVLVVKLKKDILQENAQLVAQKDLAFGSHLKTFDAQVLAYRSGNLSLSAYAKALWRNADDVSLEMETFLQAAQMEETLNFPKVEAERSLLLKDLFRTLSKDELSQLTSQSVAYRLGNLSHADFYSFLRALCEEHHVSLARFPEMNAYITYVLLTTRINTDKVLQNIRALEEKRYLVLAKTDVERHLIQESRFLYLKGKLLDFALTKDEWGEYKEYATGNWRHLLSFEKFYVLAEARDRAMAENLSRAMETYHAKKVVLVTGGFHSAGLMSDLTSHNSNLTSVSFVPSLSKLESASGTEYLSIFTQEKTPLDKLFDGDKLFLAPRNWTLRDAQLSGLMAVAYDKWKGRAIDVGESFKKLLPLAVVDIHRAIVNRDSVDFVLGQSRGGEWIFHVSFKNETFENLPTLSESVFVLSAWWNDALVNEVKKIRLLAPIVAALACIAMIFYISQQENVVPHVMAVTLLVIPNFKQLIERIKNNDGPAMKDFLLPFQPAIRLTMTEFSNVNDPELAHRAAEIGIITHVQKKDPAKLLELTFARRFIRRRIIEFLREPGHGSLIHIPRNNDKYQTFLRVMRENHLSLFDFSGWNKELQEFLKQKGLNLSLHEISLFLDSAAISCIFSIQEPFRTQKNGFWKIEDFLKETMPSVQENDEFDNYFQLLLDGIPGQVTGLLEQLKKKRSQVHAMVFQYRIFPYIMHGKEKKRQSEIGHMLQVTESGANKAEKEVWDMIRANMFLLAAKAPDDNIFKNLDKYGSIKKKNGHLSQARILHQVGAAVLFLCGAVLLHFVTLNVDFQTMLSVSLAMPVFGLFLEKGFDDNVYPRALTSEMAQEASDLLIVGMVDNEKGFKPAPYLTEPAEKEVLQWQEEINEGYKILMKQLKVETGRAPIKLVLHGSNPQRYPRHFDVAINHLKPKADPVYPDESMITGMDPQSELISFIDNKGRMHMSIYLVRRAAHSPAVRFFAMEAIQAPLARDEESLERKVKEHIFKKLKQAKLNGNNEKQLKDLAHSQSLEVMTIRPITSLHASLELLFRNIPQKGEKVSSSIFQANMKRRILQFLGDALYWKTKGDIKFRKEFMEKWFSPAVAQQIDTYLDGLSYDVKAFGIKEVQSALVNWFLALSLFPFHLSKFSFPVNPVQFAQISRYIARNKVEQDQLFKEELKRDENSKGPKVVFIQATNSKDIWPVIARNIPNSSLLVLPSRELLLRPEGENWKSITSGELTTAVNSYFTSGQTASLLQLTDYLKDDKSDKYKMRPFLRSLRMRNNEWAGIRVFHSFSDLPRHSDDEVEPAQARKVIGEYCQALKLAADLSECQHVIMLDFHLANFRKKTRESPDLLVETLEKTFGKSNVSTAFHMTIGSPNDSVLSAALEGAETGSFALRSPHPELLSGLPLRNKPAEKHFIGKQHIYVTKDNDGENDQIESPDPSFGVTLGPTMSPSGYPASLFYLEYLVKYGKASLQAKLKRGLGGATAEFVALGLVKGILDLAFTHGWISGSLFFVVLMIFFIRHAVLMRRLQVSPVNLIGIGFVCVVYGVVFDVFPINHWSTTFIPLVTQLVNDTIQLFGKQDSRAESSDLVDTNRIASDVAAVINTPGDATVQQLDVLIPTPSLGVTRTQGIPKITNAQRVEILGKIKILTVSAAKRSNEEASVLSLRLNAKLQGTEGADPHAQVLTSLPSSHEGPAFVQAKNNLQIYLASPESNGRHIQLLIDKNDYQDLKTAFGSEQDRVTLVETDGSSFKQGYFDIDQAATDIESQTGAPALSGLIVAIPVGARFNLASVSKSLLSALRLTELEQLMSGVDQVAPIEDMMSLFRIVTKQA